MLVSLCCASTKNRCYIDFMPLGLFYPYPKKRCYVPSMIISLFSTLFLLFYLFIIFFFKETLLHYFIRPKEGIFSTKSLHYLNFAKS